MTAQLEAPVRTGSLREVFRISFPLIISSGIFAFKLFSDRMMMAWYSEQSIAAALSAGTTAFMMSSFFMGVANYANAFVAQYSGAERHDRTGLAVWQAMLFSLTAGMLLTIVGTLTSPLFHLLGHAPELALEEEAYYLVLSSGAVFALLNSSLMCFWTGRNKTWTVVAIGFSSIFLNIAFNWALIFGTAGSPYMDGAPWPLSTIGAWLNAFSVWLGAPAMGVVGAGIATVGTDALSVIAFLVLFFRKPNRREYGTLPVRVFNPTLLWRMLRFGFGNGMQMFLDVGAFAVFNLIMGMYRTSAAGATVGAASGIAISVNGVAFVPMLGIGAAASIMVGHGIGSRDIPFAVRAVKNARYLILTYMACMCLLMEVYPQFLVSLFAPGDAMNLATRELATTFLRFAGAYCIADGFFILYGNAIRGAGDTKFSMYTMGVTAWFFFAIPCMVAYWFGASYYVLWSILVFYCFSSAGIFYWRYRQGKWKSMKVIEETGAQRMRADGRSSVRLSTPIPTEEGVLTIPESEVERVEQQIARESARLKKRK
ncbi:MAG: MATE family efflux transporter [Planctomycetes bacterium]|nr:MATE family efflux transporter [Planctomycetota bacterium]